MNRVLPLSIQQINNMFTVNLPNQIETYWQPLYDRLAYATAGETALTFFQNPIGSQVGGATRTRFDTNMTNNGVMPAGQNMLVTGIQVEFLPGEAVSDADYILDVALFANSGWLSFVIGSKEFANDAPLSKFPPQYRLDVFQNADASAAPILRTYAQTRGAYYEITPTLLMSQQNFNVTLNWPALVPVSQAGSVRVTLDGFRLRNAQ